MARGRRRPASSTPTCRSCAIPSTPTFLEERWLFEAITETYLPLLDMLDGLERDGVPGALHAVAQPDPARHARRPAPARALPPPPRRAGRAERARGAAHPRPSRRGIAAPTLYLSALHRAARRASWTHWRQDLVGAFRGVRRSAGASSSPRRRRPTPSCRSSSPTPACVRAQIAVGIAEHRRHFGRAAARLLAARVRLRPGPRRRARARRRRAASCSTRTA